MRSKNKFKIKIMTRSKLAVTMMLCSLFVLNSAGHALGSNQSRSAVEPSSTKSVGANNNKPQSPFGPQITPALKPATVKFPALTGPYQVGTETFHWIDQSRPERFTADKNDRRELMIQVWYPTKATSATHKRQPYTDDPRVVKALENYAQMPANLVKALVTSTTHSLIKAPIADSKQKYPVLIFSHGFGGRNDSYRNIVEPLASQGYIIVSVQHTYNSFLTTFPNGKVAPFKDSNPDNVAHMDRLMTQVWVKDIQFVLDRLELLAQKKNYHIWKQLDLKRIGMIGHSFGGAAAAQVMLIDDRIQAGINIDGTFFGNIIPDKGLPGPFLFMIAGQGEVGNLENIDPKQYAEKYGLDVKEVTESLNYSKKRDKQGKRHSYSLTIDHADHLTFSDPPLIFEAASLIDPSSVQSVSRTHRITNEYALDFFDHFLKGKPTKLLHESKNKYKDVTLKIGEGAKTKR